jgi:hypothetical protein
LPSPPLHLPSHTAIPGNLHNPLPIPTFPHNLTLPTRPSQRIQHGARVIKPKKASIITQNKIKHKSSSGLVGNTEKLLAQKAGHLEILKGGKKEGKDGKNKGKDGNK